MRGVINCNGNLNVDTGTKETNQTRAGLIYEDPRVSEGAGTSTDGERDGPRYSTHPTTTTTTTCPTKNLENVRAVVINRLEFVLLEHRTDGEDYHYDHRHV